MKESSCEVLKRCRKSYEISHIFAETPKILDQDPTTRSGQRIQLRAPTRSPALLALAFRGSVFHLVSAFCSQQLRSRRDAGNPPLLRTPRKWVRNRFAFPHHARPLSKG